MINILLFSLCLASISNNLRVDATGMPSTLEEDLEMERQLKLINKPPLKSILTKFGYIVDCIDINKQPAFDHPLLKNHKLQKKPNFHQTITKASVNISIAKSIVIGLEKGSCPGETVPIRRTMKKDLIRAKSLLNAHIETQENPGTHVAEVFVKKNDYSYGGVSGIGSVYNPRVYKDQSSASHVWIQNKQLNFTDKIIAGWNVFPQLYGDDATYIYSLWTSDNFQKTGCYNMMCSGFVQVDKELHIGAKVDYTSVYEGIIYELAVSLSQDPITKDWWLRMVDKNVGYFPAALFSNMGEVEQVGWGGKTTTLEGAPSPPMGSGYFPDDNFVHACFYRHVAFRDSNGNDFGPSKDMVETFTDMPNCFGVEYYGDQGEEFGFSLQFGGPGGNCGD